jgi:hypothetical protein
MYYRIYAKFQGQKKFEALDLSTGAQVKNLIYATMITESEIPKLSSIFEQNKDVEFQIRKIK